MQQGAAPQELAQKGSDLDGTQHLPGWWPVGVKLTLGGCKDRGGCTNCAVGLLDWG